VIGVQSLANGDKSNSMAVKDGELLVQVQDTSAKSIELIDHHHIKPSLPCICHQPIQRWTACLGAREPRIHVFFVDTPSPTLNEFPKLSKLDLAILIGR